MCAKMFWKTDFERVVGVDERKLGGLCEGSFGQLAEGFMYLRLGYVEVVARQGT